MTDLNKEGKVNLSFEQDNGAVWVFAGDSQFGTEISHLMMMHVDEYSENELRVICQHAACEIDRLRAELEKAKAQAVPEGYVVVPKGVLDLTRFMCKTWAEIDNFVYKNCTNLGEYPVIQGTSNQFNLAKIGNQKVDNKAIPSAVKWFLESESGAEG
ncbi:hypothetical protein LJI64_001826 [Acinetobacter baumannii]